MINEYRDKNGSIVKIGDKIISDFEVKMKVLDEVYDKEFYEDYVLLARQIDDPLAFSPLSTDNINNQFTLILE